MMRKFTKGFLGAGGPAILLLFMSISPQFLSAQNHNMITGTITDNSSGEPLPGVTVSEKEDPENATSTNNRGEFALEAEEGAVLVFTYLGYLTQEMSTADKRVLIIGLEPDVSILDEAVVIGYGTKKRSEIVGAVATITGEELEDIPAPNIAAALRDRIAGVSVDQQSGRPGASISLNIRSSATSENARLYGVSTDPLFIIDGITVPQSQFDALDASMVKEITILKDAASAAIYGASGAKGVVIVTTKRGRVGKPKLSYNGYVGVSDAIHAPEMLSAYEHAKLLNDSYDAEGDVSYTEYFSEEDLEKLKNSDIKSWYDELWQASIMQKHNVSISGGSEKITFFVGGNYQNENANYANMKQDRYGFRSGVNTSITQDLKADVSFSVNHRVRTSQNGLNATDQNYFESMITTPRWVPLEIDGKPVTYGGVKNPLAIVNSGYFEKSASTSYQINASLSYSPSFLKGLTARFRVGQSGSNSNSSRYEPPYKQYNFLRTGNNGLLYTNQLDSLNPTSDGRSPDNARIFPGLSRGSSYQGNLTLTYDKTIGDHSFNLMAGGERSESNNENLEIYWDNQLIGGISEFWAFDQTELTFRSREIGEGIKQSFFGRFSYNYKGKYLVQGVGRYDATTNFATDNIWGFFPSIALGWNISEESFFKDNVSFVNHLKIRLSYGLTGDDRVTARLWQERYNIDLVNTGYLYNEVSQATLNPSNIPNPDITWEKSRMLNAGVEASFLNDKISLGVEVFHRFSYDQFDKNNDSNFPMFAGFKAPVINNQERHTYGSEFSIDYRGKIGKEVRFNTSVNFGFSNSYISQMFINRFQLFENTYPDFQYQLGTNPAKWNGGNFGLISKGILRTQADVDALLKENPNYTINEEVPEAGWLYYEDSNGDGKIDERDYVPMFDRTNPLLATGISFRFTYRSLSLRANVAANFGGKVFYDSRAVDAPRDDRNVADFWFDRWTPENPDGKFPRYDDPGAGESSTFWAVDGTMVRINNMSLSYTVPKPALDKIGLSSASILITGNNLWTLVNPLDYKDPYTSYIYDYPTISTISLGLKLGL